MSAICNGLSLHGGLIPYEGTFLTFSDYARNALRMAALMKMQNIFVYTHDSIGLGEDGPTHQPVEHTASLRLMPNMSVWRPCDTVETAIAWRYAIERRDGPTSLVLTRQGLPYQARSATQLADAARGGYVLKDTDGTPDIILIATGSEVAARAVCRRGAVEGAHRGTRRVAALDRCLRYPGCGLPGVGIAPGGHGACRDRGGGHRRLVALRWHKRARDRAGSFRRVSTG